MNDLDLIKSIAEIEGVKLRGLHVIRYALAAVEPQRNEYNPLTDDALCFQLMVKYKVDVRHYIDGSVDAYITFNKQEVTGSNLNKAVCLAIISSVDRGNK